LQEKFQPIVKDGKTLPGPEAITVLAALPELKNPMTKYFQSFKKDQPAATQAQATGPGK